MYLSNQWNTVVVTDNEIVYDYQLLYAPVMQGGTTGHIITISSVNSSDAGMYTCTNGGSSDTVTVTITMNNRMQSVYVCVCCVHMYVCVGTLSKHVKAEQQLQLIDHHNAQVIVIMMMIVNNHNVMMQLLTIIMHR